MRTFEKEIFHIFLNFQDIDIHSLKILPTITKNFYIDNFLNRSTLAKVGEFAEKKTHIFVNSPLKH